MFATVAQWLKQQSQPPILPDADTGELAGLMAGLMVEAASADGEVSKDETRLIAGAIARQFELDAAEAEQLVSQAEAAADERVELFGLVSKLRGRSDYEERIGILEMVWMVVLVDGHLDHLEAQMMRRLAGLLFVSDVDSALAAKTAKQRLGLAP